MATARIRGGIGADGPYWDALDAGRFELSRCGGCGEWMWPAHFRCGTCGSWDIAWESVEPRGTIFTWTKNHLVSDTLKERRPQLPYVTLLVELPQAGGARVAGMLAGSEEGLRIGAPVTGTIEPASDRSRGYSTMVWSLAPAASSPARTRA